MKLDKRRRREHKTNYHKRLILLKGNALRLVVRKSNRYLILQIVESTHAQDKILYSTNTKELLKQGWPEDKKGSLKSLTAAYLGGYLLGKKANEIKQKVILDSGLIPNTKGSKVYAAVKGLSDAGIEIPFKKEVAPSDKAIEGEFGKLDSETFNKVKESIDKSGGGK